MFTDQVANSTNRAGLELPKRQIFDCKTAFGVIAPTARADAIHIVAHTPRAAAPSRMQIGSCDGRCEGIIWRSVGVAETELALACASARTVAWPEPRSSFFAVGAVLPRPRSRDLNFAAVSPRPEWSDGLAEGTRCRAGEGSRRAWRSSCRAVALAM